MEKMKKIIDNVKIEELQAERKRYLVELKNIRHELKFADRIETKKILQSISETTLRKIRGVDFRIDWERRKYDFTASKDYEKVKQLSRFLGKEISSAFSSDKGTPQILLGIKYKEGEPNYSSDRWTGTVMYYFQNTREIKDTSLQFIKPKK